MKGRRERVREFCLGLRAKASETEEARAGVLPLTSCLTLSNLVSLLSLGFFVRKSADTVGLYEG